MKEDSTRSEEVLSGAGTKKRLKGSILRWSSLFSYRTDKTDRTQTL